MKAFTLIEVLVGMIIVVGSIIFLLKAIMSTQKAIIFSKHKQESVFLIEERIERMRNMEWATVTPGRVVEDRDINWNIGGVLERNIGPIEFSIIPGNVRGTGTGLGRPSIGSGTLNVDEKGVLGGTFTVSCAWREDNKWATTTYTVYLVTNKSLFEESRSFME